MGRTTSPQRPDYRAQCSEFARSKGGFGKSSRMSPLARTVGRLRTQERSPGGLLPNYPVIRSARTCSTTSRNTIVRGACFSRFKNGCFPKPAKPEPKAGEDKTHPRPCGQFWMIRRYTSAQFVPANAGAKAKNPVGSTLFSTPMVALPRHPGHKILRTSCREPARKRLWFYAAIGRSRACSSSRRNSGCGARHMVRYASRKGSRF